MADDVNFDITAGLPFSKLVVVSFPPDRDWWLTLPEFEVLMQIREKEDRQSKLILDLAEYLTVTLADANTVFALLNMTGHDTRFITKSGYYDLVISDAGLVDARAYIMIKGRVLRDSTITAEQRGLL